MSIGFVFPGQGSQSLGMLKALSDEFSIVPETFAEASDVLRFDLWQLVQEGPEEKLNQTQYTQPALLAASVAIWRIWESQNTDTPVLLAGHSLGEYSALVCANALDFSSAIGLVAERGRFMQEAVGEGVGAMAAIVGLDNEKIASICQEAAQGEIVAPANFNSIGQVVISGQAAAIERAINLAKTAGAKIAKLIPVSVPSHCALMKPAAEKLQQSLLSISFYTPEIAVINNVDVSIEQDPVKIKDALIRQLVNPVRWVETVESMVKQKINVLIECGPGKVLAGLNKRIDSNISTLSVNDPDSLKAAVLQTQ